MSYNMKLSCIFEVQKFKQVEIMETFSGKTMDGALREYENWRMVYANNCQIILTFVVKMTSKETTITISF